MSTTQGEYRVYRVRCEADGTEMSRTPVATKREEYLAQGLAMARNVQEKTDDIYVVVREVQR